MEKDILEIDPQGPELGRNGKVSFRVRVKDVSMSFDNRDFRLQVSAVTKTNKYSINPVVSEPMTVSTKCTYTNI